MIQKISVGPMGNAAYLVGDSSTSLCAAIDPAWNAQEFLRAASAAGWKIAAILLTHSHFDHANAAPALATATGANVYVHRADLPDLPGDMTILTTEEGSYVRVGELDVQCLHTPGHTPGSQCFLVGDALFTGDTLFVDGCGRVDLPGSSPRDMVASLKRLASLDPAITIHPGHDYGPAPTATIGEQLKSNPFLSATTEEVLL